ncbi:hypothetical protein [Bosea sp. PAMC 26642]|uniref:hypothetical protein n=1 Tax=Bosea sp. (strain PAMC 26642) TaxID=1792307 RepID=UPI001F41C163|nr:hypothetical protein [Bosea sp. PAMC 26642]
MSTMLMMAIGTLKSRAAIAVVRSNAPSGGVSRMSYRRTAIIRAASFSGRIEREGVSTRLMYRILKKANLYLPT